MRGLVPRLGSTYRRSAARAAKSPPLMTCGVGAGATGGVRGGVGGAVADGAGFGVAAGVWLTPTLAADAPQPRQASATARTAVMVTRAFASAFMSISSDFQSVQGGLNQGRGRDGDDQRGGGLVGQLIKGVSR